MTDFILAVGFVTPWLMGLGAAATSIPIVIHLLNKRRFRVVIWAAMEWLLAAHRRNARRLKFQRWLLLALRVLAILVLAAAIAQLFLTCAPGSVIARTLSGGKQVVIVLDDSYSMAYAKQGQPTTFARGKELVIKYLETLAPGDTAMVIRTSDTSPAVTSKLMDPKKVADLVKPMAVSDANTNLPGALLAAADVFEAERDKSRQRNVIVVTDLSRSSLPAESPRAGSNAPAPLKAAATKIKTLATLQIADLGNKDQANLGIVNARMINPIAVAEEEVKVEATIYNATLETAKNVAVTVIVDGIKRPTETLPQIEPGKPSSFITSVKFPSPGPHAVEFQIAADLLPTDDVRRLVIDVQRNIPMLVVDGRPSDGHTWSSTWSIQAMAQAFGGYGTTVVSDAQLGSVPINKQKLIVFSDAVAPAPAAAAAIADFVREGGLLIVFPGDQTIGNSTVWKERFGSRGLNLLPSDFGQVQTPRSEAFPDGVELDPLEYAHPALRPFGEEIRGGKKFLLQTYKTKRYFQLAIPTGDDTVEAVMRFRKDDGSLGGDPAILTRRFGRGRVIQFAVGLGNDWSGLTSGAGDFPPLFDQLIKTELSGGTDKFTMLVGESLDLAAEVAAPGSWNAPRNSKVAVTREPKRGVVTTAPAGVVPQKPPERLYSIAPLTIAGFYGPENSTPVAAVNPDGGEADIRHLTDDEFEKASGVEKQQIFAQPESLNMVLQAAGVSQQNEAIGRWLLLAALILFGIETVCARMFSVYR